MKKTILVATLAIASSYAYPQTLDLSAFAAQGTLQPPPPFETVMERNDLDKDGVIMKEEAVQAGTQLGKGFDNWDPNKDGKIEADEVHYIIDAINAAIAQQSVGE